MLKNIVQFEHTIEGITGKFLIDNMAPFNIAKDLLICFLNHISQMEAQSKPVTPTQDHACSESQSPGQVNPEKEFQ